MNLNFLAFQMNTTLITSAKTHKYMKSRPNEGRGTQGETA